MRLQGLATTTAIGALFAGSVFLACSKSDGGGKDGDKDNVVDLSDENKADAKKGAAASASALSKLGGSTGGSGLLDHETRQRIRQLYRQGQAMQAMADETDPGMDPGMDPGGFDPSDFQFNCGMMYGPESCEAMAQTPPTLGEGGPSCTASCPEGGNGMTFACTIDSYDVQCGADTYKMTDGTMSSTTTCTDNDDGSMTLAIGSSTDVKMTGGSIAEPVALKCAFNFDMKLDFAGMGGGEGAEGEGDDTFNMDKMCESFSCTVGGVAITCEDMKAAMQDNSCDEPAAE